MKKNGGCDTVEKSVTPLWELKKKGGREGRLRQNQGFWGFSRSEERYDKISTKKNDQPGKG